MGLLTNSSRGVWALTEDGGALLTDPGPRIWAVLDADGKPHSCTCQGAHHRDHGHRNSLTGNGELIAAERLERSNLRSKWLRAWKRASASKLRRWF
jgi:hypothetical protein